MKVLVSIMEGCALLSEIKNRNYLLLFCDKMYIAEIEPIFLLTGWFGYQIFCS